MLCRSVPPALFLLLTAGALHGQSPTPRNQLALDAGNTYAFGVSYVRRIQSSPFLFGGRLGFAWELNDHSFTRQVWNVIHIEAFGRIQPVPWFHGDLGVSLATTSPADDTSEKRSFYGLYAAAMIGYRFIFIGPQIRVGVLDSDFGRITNLAVRAVLPFGT